MRCTPLLTLGLAGLLVVNVPGLAQAGQDAYSIYAEKLQAADAAVQRGASQEAIEQLTQAYRALPVPDRATRLGSDVVERAARLAQEAYLDGSKDRASIEMALGLLNEHLGDLDRVAPDTDTSPFDQHKRRLEAAHSTLAGAPATSTTPAPPPESGTAKPARARRASEPKAETESGSSTDGAPGDRPASGGAATQQRNLGLGLAISGAVAVAGGIGWIGYASWYRTDSTDTRDRCRSSMQPSELDCANIDGWYDGERRKFTTHFVVGAIITAAGAAMLATGVAFVVRNPKGREVSRMALAPMGSGAALVGRF